MSAWERFFDGELRERADDATRTVTTWDAAGQVTSTRPYSPEENAAADSRAASEQAQAQREATRAAVRAIVDDLRAEKARAQAVIDATNATINAGPAPYVKDVARAAKRIADAAIDDLARFVRDM